MRKGGELIEGEKVVMELFVSYFAVMLAIMIIAIPVSICLAVVKMWAIPFIPRTLFILLVLFFALSAPVSGTPEMFLLSPLAAIVFAVVASKYPRRLTG